MIKKVGLAAVVVGWLARAPFVVASDETFFFPGPYSLSAQASVVLRASSVDNPFPVVGFSVSFDYAEPIADDAWASDQAFIISAPNGSSVQFNGYDSVGDPPGPAQGVVIANWWGQPGSEFPGFYSSGPHFVDSAGFPVFGGPTPKEGTWTITIINDWSPDPNPNVISNVTITLHKDKSGTCVVDILGYPTPAPGGGNCPAINHAHVSIGEGGALLAIGAPDGGAYFWTTTPLGGAISPAPFPAPNDFVFGMVGTEEGYVLVEVEYVVIVGGEEVHCFDSACVHVVDEDEEPVNNPPIGKITKKLCWSIGGDSYDTVILSTGEYYLTETDLKIPGRGFDFEFTRTYRSRSSLTPSTFVSEGGGQLGSHWDFNYNMRLKANPDGSYTYFDGAGRKDAYNTPSNPNAPPPGYYDAFQIIQPGIEAEITKKDGTRFRYLKPVGDAFLRLRSITDRNGNHMDFDYDASGRLATIHDTLDDPTTHNRHITFMYNPDGTLEGFRDFAGREIKYAYDADASRMHLVKATSPTVSYVENPFSLGKSSHYTYDTSSVTNLQHNLLTVACDDGTVFLANSYDSADRLLSQRYGEDLGPGMNMFSYEYIDNPTGEPANHMLTRERDRNGNLTEWLINRNVGDPADFNAGHVVRKSEFVELIPGSGVVPLITTYEHNRWGEKKREVLPRGNLIEYVFDEDNPDDPRQKGNLLSTARKAHGGDPGLVTSYTYETQYNQVKTTVDPRDNTTTNFFDYEEETMGDLNDDGVVDQSHGNIVKIQFPQTNVPGGSLQNPVRKTQYNDFGQVIREIAPEGNAVAYEYHTTIPMVGYLQKKVRYPDGVDGEPCENTFAYDLVGNVVLQTDGFGRPTNFEVNELNQVQRTISREVTLHTGAMVRYETVNHYDINNQIEFTEVLNITDDGMTPPPIRNEFEYDILCNLTRKRAQKAPGVFIETSHAYDLNENLVVTTLPEGNEMAYEYDERDLRIAETRGVGTPQQSTSQTGYDANGNVIQRISGQGRTTSYQFDGYDRLTLTVDGDGNRVVQSYDNNGNPIETIRQDSTLATLARTVNHYDELNRLDIVSVDHFDENGQPIGDGISRMTSFFDRNNRLVRTEDDNGHETVYQYDELDRRVLVTDALGNLVATNYDCNDNVLTVTETEQGLGGPFVFTTNNDYDALDRLIATTDPGGHATQFTYDSRSNRIKTIDALSNRVLNEYDDLSRLVRTKQELRVGGTGAGAIDTSDPINPDGLVTTEMEYDDNGNVTARIQDDNGVCNGGCRITFAYDPLDRLILETYPATPEYPAGTVRSFEYDRDGNVTEMTDQNGTVVANTYDDLNRLTDVAVARGPGVGGTTVQTFEYDGLSRMTMASDNNDPADPTDDHSVEWAYDSLSNVRLETHDGLFDVRSVHDGVGFRTKLTYPSGRILSFTPDPLNRIETICEETPPCAGADQIADFEYVGPGRVSSRTLGNQTTAQYGYDADRRLTSIQHSVTGGGPDLMHLAYAYDDVDNRTQKIETRQEVPDPIRWDYAYDSAYRLLREVDPTGVTPVEMHERTFTYDGNGNRIESTVVSNLTEYEFDAMNQYVAIDAVSQFHDANGNLVQNGSDGDLDNDGDVDMDDFLILTLCLRGDGVAPPPGCEAADFDAGNDVDDNDYFIFHRQLLGPSVPVGAGMLARYTYDFKNRLVEHVNIGSGMATKYEYDATGRRVAKTVDVGGSGESSLRYLCDGAEVIEERDAQALTTYVYSNRIDDVITMRRSEGPECVLPPANLVSWWPGEGNAFDIWDGNPGSVSPTTTFEPGRVGQAIRLDGNNDSGVIPHAPNLAPVNALTIEFWVKADVVQPAEAGGAPPAGYYTVVDKSHYYNPPDTSGAWYFQRAAPDTDQLAFGLYAGGQNGVVAWTEQPINDNQWHHIAGTYDGAFVRVYMDGHLDDEQPCSGPISQNNRQINIGRYYLSPGAEGRWFRGMVDELSIYDRALGAVEVQAIFAAGSQGKCPPSAPPSSSQGEDRLESAPGLFVAPSLRGPALDAGMGQRAATDLYFHADALGTITHVTDAAGALVEAYQYDAFGNLTITDPAGASLAQSAIDNVITYTGRWFDPETNLYFYRARYYDPATGRFLARDPKGFVEGMNLYAYTLNRATKFTDPTGRGVYRYGRPMEDSLPLLNIDHDFVVVKHADGSFTTYSYLGTKLVGELGYWEKDYKTDIDYVDKSWYNDETIDSSNDLDPYIEKAYELLSKLPGPYDITCHNCKHAAQELIDLAKQLQERARRKKGEEKIHDKRMRTRKWIDEQLEDHKRSGKLKGGKVSLVPPPGYGVGSEDNVGGTPKTDPPIKKELEQKSGRRYSVGEGQK